MGAIGRYIDRLPENAVDRVLMAQSWAVGDALGARGGRCLVGHAEDYRVGSDGCTEVGDMRATAARHPHTWKVPLGFDMLAARVGLGRAVSLVKARAGKRTRVALAEPLAATTTPE